MHVAEFSILVFSAELYEVYFKKAKDLGGGNK